MADNKQIFPLPWTPARIILVILLFLFCMPVGICYLAWLTGGRKGLYISLAIIFIPTFLLSLFLWSVSQSDSGENVRKVSWLKEEDACWVSYYRSYNYTAYEYQVSEKSFLKHANPLWKFQEINEPVRVTRYLLMTKYKGNLCGGTPTDAVAVVKNGLVAEERWRNGGGYIAVYDRDTGKVYIQKNPR